MCSHYTVSVDRAARHEQTRIFTCNLNQIIQHCNVKMLILSFMCATPSPSPRDSKRVKLSKWTRARDSLRENLGSILLMIQSTFGNQRPTLTNQLSLTEGERNFFIVVCCESSRKYFRLLLLFISRRRASEMWANKEGRGSLCRENSLKYNFFYWFSAWLSRNFLGLGASLPLGCDEAAGVISSPLTPRAMKLSLHNLPAK